MKIRMLVSVSGHADPNYEIGDFAFAPGQVVDVHKALAAAWIASGHADKVKRATAAEDVAEPAEAAAEQPTEASAVQQEPIATEQPTEVAQEGV